MICRIPAVSFVTIMMGTRVRPSSFWAELFLARLASFASGLAEAFAIVRQAAYTDAVTNFMVPGSFGTDSDHFAYNLMTDNYRVGRWILEAHERPLTVDNWHSGSSYPTRAQCMNVAATPAYSQLICLAYCICQAYLHSTMCDPDVDIRLFPSLGFEFGPHHLTLRGRRIVAYPTLELVILWWHVCALLY